jgi:hypothetical protein
VPPQYSVIKFSYQLTCSCSLLEVADIVAFVCDSTTGANLKTTIKTQPCGGKPEWQ